MMLNNIRLVVSVFSIADTPSRRWFSRPVRELSYFIWKKNDIAQRKWQLVSRDRCLDKSIVEELKASILLFTFR